MSQATSLAAEDVLIEVDRLTIGWAQDAVLQRDASFEVKRGDIFVILGGSGCGKLTLLRHLVGLEEPLSGTISIAGLGKPRLDVGRPPFGVMFQGGALFGSLTVGENVALPVEQWTDLPHDAVTAIVRAKLRLVGLSAAEDKFPSEISGGMKKRAAIARAMALEPELMFLDEPSAGLDPVSAVELDELILTLNRGLGLTVVIVTHELESIFKIGKRCIMLDKATKSIIARGNPVELRDTATDPRVVQFFHRQVDPNLGDRLTRGDFDMSAPSNHWKLGLFVVTGFGLSLAVVVFLGARSFDTETVTYRTYFDESVQGLDVGSPVKYRGVTIGSVSGVDVAPDRRHVEIDCGIVVSQLASLKLLDTTPKKKVLPFGRKAPATLAVPPDLRMQLDSAGITGVKFISLDFFDPKDDPPPELPFPVGENYIPAAPSMMKSLEDSVVKAVNRFPEIADQLLGVVSQVNQVMTAINREKLPQQASATLARAGEVLNALQGMLKQANVGKLSGDASALIGELSHAIQDMDAMLAKMDGQGGLIASAQRATDSMGDLAGGAKDVGAELSETLRGVREAADSIQRLTDALDTDSDMLLKGRAKGRP